MDSIGGILGKVKLTRKSNHSTNYQVRGSEICKDLGGKEYSLFIRLYKLNASRCEQVYSWVKDYPNPKNKVRLFLWKYGDLGKKHE